MTLDTHVVIKNPDVAPEAVMEFVNRELLAAPNAARREWPPPWLTPEYLAENYAGITKIGNQIGQGLSALTEITYRDPLAPIVGSYMSGWTDTGEPDPDCDDDDYERADRDLVTGSMVVSFDTAYGYREGDARCGDLHAHFIVRLAKEYGPVAWLDERAGSWHRLGPEADQGEWATLTARLGSPRRGWEAVQGRSVTA